MEEEKFHMGAYDCPSDLIRIGKVASLFSCHIEKPNPCLNEMAS